MKKKYNYKAVLKMLLKEGWYIKAQKGSHVQLAHPTKPDKVTLTNHGKELIPPGTLDNIWKQAGWE